ncbi:MAG: hypothetical protein NTY90_00815 [Candidatus Micrarchaeota archaeon]|nr:hypothetical protein [Candidatus Micrarchaeota archaeon]
MEKNDTGAEIIKCFPAAGPNRLQMFKRFEGNQLAVIAVGGKKLGLKGTRPAKIEAFGGKFWRIPTLRKERVEDERFDAEVKKAGDFLTAVAQRGLKKKPNRDPLSLLRSRLGSRNLPEHQPYQNNGEYLIEVAKKFGMRKAKRD